MPVETLAIGQITTPQQGVEALLIALQKRSEVGELVQHSERLNGFDLEAYERVIAAESREVTPLDLKKVAELYRHCEIHPDVFSTLALGEEAEAERMLSESGGMVDRWIPTPEELQVLRNIDVDYIPSGEEFAMFLDGSHNRPGEFRCIGLFDRSNGTLLALAAGWFPPTDIDRLRRYADENSQFLSGTHPKMKFVPEMTSTEEVMTQCQANPESLMEFYLLIDAVRGGATVICDDFMQMVAHEYPNVKDVGVSRFASMQMRVPNNNNHLTDGDNSPSRRLFKGGLGLSTIGTWRSDAVIAARTNRERSVVVVQPCWKYMRPKGGIASVIHNARQRRAALDARAVAAKRSVERTMS